MKTVRTVKTRFLWDRFLSCWLPPEDVTGDVRGDIDKALRKTYTYEGGTGTFALKGGPSGIVITEAATRVASKIPPRRTPDWLEWVGALPRKDVTAFLDEAVRDLIATPRPHVIIKTGRSPLALDEIVLGNGTLVVVNEPGRTTATDSVRVRRARRALEVFGSVSRMKDARRLLDDRSKAMADTDEIDRKIRSMIEKLRITPDTFFDAVALLEGTTRLELKLVEQGS